MELPSAATAALELVQRPALDGAENHGASGPARVKRASTHWRSGLHDDYLILALDRETRSTSSP